MIVARFVSDVSRHFTAALAADATAASIVGDRRERHLRGDLAGRRVVDVANALRRDVVSPTINEVLQQLHAAVASRDWLGSRRCGC